MRIKRIKNLIYITSSIMVLGLALLSFDSAPMTTSGLPAKPTTEPTRKPGHTATPTPLPSETPTPSPSPTPTPSLAQLNAAVPIQPATDETGAAITEQITSYLTTYYQNDDLHVKEITDITCYYKKGISLADYIVYATYTIHYEGSNVPIPAIGEYCISINEDASVTVIEHPEEPELKEALYLSRASESVSTLYIQETIRRYMYARLACDEVLLSDLVTNSASININDVATKTQYIEEYRNFEYLIRTCPETVTEFDHIAYVTYDVKIVNISTLAPGMDEFLVALDEENYPKIFFGTTSTETDNFRIASMEMEDFRTRYNDVYNRLADAMILDPDLMEFMNRIDNATGSSGE